MTFANSSDERDYRKEAKEWASDLHDAEIRGLAEEAAEIVLRRGFELPTLVEKKLPKGKLAAYTGETNEIWVSSQKPKGGWIKHLKEREEAGYSSHSNSILHEFGHYIHSMLDPRDYDSSGYNRGSYNKPPEKGYTSEHLSVYATTSIKEYEAELMAGILSGKVYPSVIINGSYLRNITLSEGSADERAQALKRMAIGEVPNTSMLEKQFGSMMEALFHEDGASLRIELLAHPEVAKFTESHAQVMDNAFMQVEMSETMRNRLKESDYIFSGFKTFHELNEAFPSLLDGNGNKKPFDQFLKDVKKIDQTYNERYLRAEYNFAGASADMAARWEQFSKDEDEYYLQYRTANDGAVRPEHAALHDVTLPASDSFWDSYYPPNGWNCRCTVVQVLKYMHEATPHDEAMQRGAAALAKDKKGMFNFNPGKQQKTFPDYNPYTISKCNTCSKKLDLAKGIAENDLCEACLSYLRTAKEEVSQKFTLKQRRQIYARPLDEQFVDVYNNGKAVVKRHLIKSILSEDYYRVLDVAKAYAQENQSTVYILPEINRNEKEFRRSLGLSTDNGNTPDIMLSVGFFVDVKSPMVEDKISRNAGKATKQSAIACITDHRLSLKTRRLDDYADRIFGNENYQFNEVHFYIGGHLYKKTKE